MPYLIPGNPVPLQRPRFNKWGSRPWDSQKSIKRKIGILISLQNRLKMKYEGPLELDITFYFPLKNRCAGSWHASRPDLSNLIKLIEDIAQGILFRDDAQICSIIARKAYAADPRTEFTLRELAL